MRPTETLAEYVLMEKFENFPGRVIQRTKQMVLDNIGCAFGGYITETGKGLVEFAKEMGGNKETTIIGDGTKIPCMIGAGVNAQLANILDFDETSKSGHLGSSTLQAALGIGEKIGSSGKRIIEAFVTGYEVANRISEAGDISRLKERGAIPRSSDVFGPAIAAAKLLDLDLEEVKETIGIAGGIAPTKNIRRLIDRPSHMIKTGNLWFCWSGIVAALLARRGFKGPYDYLDGDRGYWSIFTDKVNFNIMTEKLGMYYYVSDQLQLKPWPTCRYIHPGIELVLDILEEKKIRPEDIEEIRFKSADFFCSPPYNEPKPREMWDGFWSVPWGLALAVLGVEPGPDWWAKEKFEDPAILNLAKKIKVEPLPEATKAFNTRGIERLVGQVEVKVKGRVFTRKTEGVKGDPRCPMTEQEVIGKFKGLVRNIIDEKQTNKIIEVVNNFEAVEDVNQITDLFKA